MYPWSPVSWQNFIYEQAPHYPDVIHLMKIVERLKQLPPLVSKYEIEALKYSIAKAGRGDAFILQGGDCAETFKDCRSEIINNKLKILLQMSHILSRGIDKPIVQIGRIAGQYAKPRSSATETIKGITLPSYHGDLVNSALFEPRARIPNPNLLLQGYHCAAATLNYIRAALNKSFSDHNPSLPCSHLASTESLDLTMLLEDFRRLNCNKVDFYTSHEALNLHYEAALTRVFDERWYNLSTHLPWIGMRTAKLNSAHLEFLRGVQNPIGIKLGPEFTPELLLELLKIVNPQREEGRLLLITRLGAEHISQKLPPLINAVKAAHWPVTWSCDPMHGNTEITAEGIKTRHFDVILAELQQAVNIHQQMGSYLGGVHLELTGENVTECIGGACGLENTDLKRAYHSLVDPRLNYEQSLEIAIQLCCQFSSMPRKSGTNKKVHLVST